MPRVLDTLPPARSLPPPLEKLPLVAGAGAGVSLGATRVSNAGREAWALSSVCSFAWESWGAGVTGAALLAADTAGSRFLAVLEAKGRACWPRGGPGTGLPRRYGARLLWLGGM